jgi:predicted DCC family thiol-disulfide oxidoreductase YuxK
MAQPSSCPDRVIIFDGECNFCSAWVDFVLRRDVDGSIRFAARQSPAARQLLGRLGMHADNLSSIALVIGDDVHTRSDAVLRIFRALPYPWRVLCVFLFVPRWIRDAVYLLVARARYRLFGHRTACRLEDADHPKRFL